MTETTPKVYCGPAGLVLRNIVGIKTTNTFGTYFGGSSITYVHKGRTAIRLACDLLGLGPDSEILAPSYNCGSEIDALLTSGASVIIYQIDKTATIDIKDLERKITNRTKAVYVTHYFGFPHSLENIKKVCEKNNLYLIEDCALALFSWHNNKMIGTTGDIAIFSLPKTLPTPDGGILLVNNAVAQGKSFSLSQPERLKIFMATLPLLKAGLIRWLSHTPVLNNLYKIYANIKQSNCTDNGRSSIQVQNDMPQSYYYVDQDSNKNISSFTRQLTKTFEPHEIREKRRRNYRMLSAMLELYPGGTPLYKELPDHVCPLYFPIIVRKRDEVHSKLNNLGIDARAWWKGYHRDLPWKDFPEACFLKDNLLALPINQHLSETDIAYIADTVANLTS
jgi:perosamine synthetase